MKKNIRDICILAIEIFGVALILFLVGCAGGGTIGTGVNVLDGNISTSESMGIPGVKVTVAETGDFATTDEQGNFILEAQDVKREITLLLEGPTFKTSTIVYETPEDSSRISLQLKIDPAGEVVHLAQFSVRADMIKTCAQFFENGQTINQIKKVPRNTTCTLRVKVYGDGMLRRNIPVVLQHSPCGTDNGWKDYAGTLTGDGKIHGLAYVDFVFRESFDFCKYRLVAPYDYKGFRPVYYPIETIKQRENRNK